MRIFLGKDEYMSTFSVIAIIFNPNSTGSSQEEAERLKAELATAGVTVEVHLTPTQHAGHAIDLAYDLAKNNDRPLIISASGDGGYNEVVNGALRAQSEGATPVCAVLPTGNANDHSHSVGDRPLVEAIAAGDTQKIDLLHATIASSTEERSRYAHSYIGLGLTPTVAVELNRNELNRLKETYIVYKTLKDLQPVEILVDGKKITIDSLVLANINRMAKVLTIAENASPDDGQMKLTIFPYHRKHTLILMLIKAMITGIRGKSIKRYEFIAVKGMAMQLDGEVEELKANDTITVTVSAGALTTLS